jgi:hypothetical protein
VDEALTAQNHFFILAGSDDNDDPNPRHSKEHFNE